MEAGGFGWQSLIDYGIIVALFIWLLTKEMPRRQKESEQAFQKATETMSGAVKESTGTMVQAMGDLGKKFEAHAVKVEEVIRDNTKALGRVEGKIERTGSYPAAEGRR